MILRALGTFLCVVGAVVGGVGFFGGLIGFLAGGFDFIDGGEAMALMAYIPVGLASGIVGFFLFLLGATLRKKGAQAPTTPTTTSPAV